jgi:hypothetical protein
VGRFFTDTDPTMRLAQLNYECPERLSPDAPPAVVAAVWGDAK